MKPTDKRALITLAITCGLAFVAFTYIIHVGDYRFHWIAGTSSDKPPYLGWLWW